MSERATTWSAEKFTFAIAELLRRCNRDLEVSIIGPLGLRLVNRECGRQVSRVIDEEYGEYLRDPARLPAIMQEIASDLLDKVSASDIGLRDRVVPIVKRREWANVLGGQNLSVATDRDYIYEELTSELSIAYAEDLQSNMRFLRFGDIVRANIAPQELQQVACANLWKRLPKVQRHGDDGIFSFVADGNYEASLLLRNSVWEETRKLVRGGLVVAVPTRNQLYATGIEFAEGLTLLRRAIRDARESRYRLSTSLLAYRDGRFEILENVE